MPTILFVRHGETDFVKKGRLAGRLPGVPLNGHGLEQAQALAKKFSGTPIKAVYSSPIERALQTAEPIARELNLEIIPRQGLIETEIGSWQNEKVRPLSRTKIWKVVQNAPSVFRFPGGETFAETQLRISSELIALSAQHEPKDVFICVSHADPIKLAVAYFLGLPLDRFQRMQISTCSVTAIQMTEMGGQLLALNLNGEISLTFLKS